MKSLLIIVISISLLWATPKNLFSQSGCTNSTYITQIGSSSAVERGLSLAYSSIEDAIYVAGSKDDSVSILKVDDSDQLEWIRTFDIVPGKPDNIHKVIVDSDGMIVATGVAGPYNTLGVVFAFRYDPVNDIMIWAKTYLSYNNCFNHGLEELTPGAPFLMSNNPTVPGNNDAQLLMLNRLTGDILPEFSFHYDVGDSEALNDIVLHNGFIYANGRYTDGPDFRDMRNTTVKINPVTGAPVWTLLGHVPGSASARLYGAGMVIDKDEIFSISVGDENGTSIDFTDIWMQKTSLDGEVQWMNKYDLPGTSDWIDEIISTEGGFILLARNRLPPSDIILFKVDRNGNLLWANKFDFANGDNSLVLGGIQGALRQIKDHIYFTAFTEQGGDADLILVKTSLDGEVSDTCGFVTPVEINVTPVKTPVFYTVDPEVFVYNPEVVSHFSQSVAGSLPLINTICSSGGLILKEVKKTICQGGQFEGYTRTGTYTDTFHLSSGCDSVRTLYLDVTTCDQLIHYDLNECTAFMSNGTNMDYSEFTPAYITSLSCATITATTAFRSPPQENKHSCTPGLNATEAMCISALESCTYTPADVASLIIEVMIDPVADSVFNWTGLRFYEKAPFNYNWISGPSGLNNYPVFYGIRILKNGSEIFSEHDIPTSLNWSLQSYDFIDNPLFSVNQPTLFRIELLPYCLVGNGEPVAAWDLEDIVLIGGCLTPEEKKPVITGLIRTPEGRPYAGPQMMLDTEPSFKNAKAVEASADGRFMFDKLQNGRPYILKGYNDSNPLNGVSTADLIAIQKHLLGIQPFTTPVQFIAADADHNLIINIRDLLLLKKLLLGIEDHFPENTSWRFGIFPAGTYMTDLSQFSEQFDIGVLNPDTTKLEVLAIKTGDLTGDATSHLTTGQITSRTPDVFELNTRQQFVMDGVPVSIDIMAGDVKTMEGLQLALKGQNLTIIGAEGNRIPLSADHLHLRDNGVIRLSWHTNEPLHVQSNDILFNLHVIPHFTGWLKNHIRLISEELSAELYCPGKSTPESIELRQVRGGEASEDQRTTRIEPNPFNTMTYIHFTLGQEDRVSIRFFNASGILVYQSNEMYTSGSHTLEITSQDLGGTRGVLYGQVYCKGFSSMHKLVLLD